MNKYIQILNLYRHNKLFMWLSIALLSSAIFSKAMYMRGYSLIGENFSTLLFVATLWVAFYLGLLIKHQFANHRASLLPGYRSAHIQVAAAIFMFFVCSAVVWENGLILLLRITPDGLQAAYMSCFFMALVITYLGYLSIGRIFIYFYVIALVVAMNGTHVLTLFEQISVLKYLVGVLSAVFIILFVRRLYTLKEHHLEYHYLLSWPPKKYLINQLRSDQLVAPLKQLLKVKEGELRVPSYPRSGNILSRAFHWDYAEQTDIKIVGVLFLLLTPLYLLLIKSHPLFSDFFRGAYSNFLLLSMTPVLVTLGSHYKKLAYCDHDLLKPITRPQYMKERGVVLVTHLLCYWLIFTVCFAVLPNIIFDPNILQTGKFWLFILLTGNFALLFTAWLVWLSCVSDTATVIVSALILGGVLLFQFYYSSVFSLKVIIWINIFCMFCVGILFRNAYSAWCRKEFT